MSTKHSSAGMKSFAHHVACVAGLVACCAHGEGLTTKNAPLIFSFGVIADVQYCDQQDNGTRFYRNSINKLPDAVQELNRNHPAFIISLGDLIDKDRRSFDTILPLFGSTPVQHVLGNHDFAIADELKEHVHEKLSMPARYYSFTQSNWRFIMLDGNGYSTDAWPKDHPNRQKGVEMLQQMKMAQARNAQPWNSAIDDEQLSWLERELQTADSLHESVILCCHFPVFPAIKETLWNDQAVLQIIDRHLCVKAFFSGHHHPGFAGQRNDVHYITFRGMVETEEQNAFALVEVYSDRLQINGFGREPNQTLPLRPSAFKTDPASTK